MKKFLNRFKDLNKWSYFMVIAFGLCLLMITLYFQFGNTAITIQGKTTDTYILPDLTISLGQGYITETHLWIRIIEGVIGIGLVVLGIERLINRKREAVRKFQDRLDELKIELSRLKQKLDDREADLINTKKEERESILKHLSTKEGCPKISISECLANRKYGEKRCYNCWLKILKALKEKGEC